jgi:hypothetical protein
VGNPNHDNLGRFAPSRGGASDLAAGLGREHAQRHHLVSGAALKAVKDTGGVTISLKGSQPAEGYAYAPRKDTEKKIPANRLKMKDIDSYIDSHFDQLSEKGGHLGMWTQDGDVYLDVSHVGPPRASTINQAQAANQLAVFDLKHFNEINVGKISNGQYRKLGEAARLHDQYRRKISGTGQSRGA